MDNEAERYCITDTIKLEKNHNKKNKSFSPFQGMQTDDDGATPRDEQQVFVNGKRAIVLEMSSMISNYNIAMHKSYFHCYID